MSDFAAPISEWTSLVRTSDLFFVDLGSDLARDQYEELANEIAQSWAEADADYGEFEFAVRLVEQYIVVETG